MQVGALMRIARKSKNFTVAHMAELMGVSQPTIVRWENGTIDVPCSVLLRFIDKLDLSPREFFNSVSSKDTSPKVIRILAKVQKLPPNKLTILESVLDTWIESD